jgi:hypothetical protein
MSILTRETVDILFLSTGLMFRAFLGVCFCVHGGSGLCGDPRLSHLHLPPMHHEPRHRHLQLLRHLGPLGEGLHVHGREVEVVRCHHHQCEGLPHPAVRPKRCGQRRVPVVRDSPVEESLPVVSFRAALFHVQC